MLHVRRQWTRAAEYGPTKTAAGGRRIAPPPGLRDELIALRLASGFSLDEQPVFASREGTPLGHRNVTRRGFEPARDEAGLPSSLTFHDLRHAAASRLIRGGLDPTTVASVLGHEKRRRHARNLRPHVRPPPHGEAVRVALGAAAELR